MCGDMLILLPPSETKIDGGTGPTLDLRRLSFPRLESIRRDVLARLVDVCRDEETAIAALKLGVQGAAEIERNRAIASTPTLPAIERYTGVLFDAIDVATLSEKERARAATRIAVHSALFGLVRADDAVPAYRLSHNSRLPGVSLVRLWRSAVSREIAEMSGLVVDLRSEGYAALGPVPARDNVVVIRVVSRTPDGAVRAISHANKRTKGAFTRDVLTLADAPRDAHELIAAAAEVGWTLEHAPRTPGRPTVLQLFAHS